jgi:hypothetical protein
MFTLKFKLKFTLKFTPNFTLKFTLKFTQISLVHVSVYDQHQGACTEPGWSYIYVKTLGKISSFYVIW